MVDRPYDIPRRSTVLVTDANGFIASNVVDELLLLGSTSGVLLVMTSLGLTKCLKTNFAKTIVTGLDIQAAFDKALQGVAGFIHIVYLSALIRNLWPIMTKTTKPDGHLMLA